jgi:hypothetical protein
MPTAKRTRAGRKSQGRQGSGRLWRPAFEASYSFSSRFRAETTIPPRNNRQSADDTSC